MKRFLVAALACLFAFPALATNYAGSPASPLSVRPGSLAPSAYCQASITTTAETLADACPSVILANATYALVCNEGGAVRWLDIGTSPTSSMGQVLGTGSATAPVCAMFTTSLAALSWIAESGSSTLDFSFYQ